MYDKTVLFSWPPITQHFFVFEAVEFERKRKKLLDDLANIWFGKLKEISQINNLDVTILLVIYFVVSTRSFYEHCTHF